MATIFYVEQQQRQTFFLKFTISQIYHYRHTDEGKDAETFVNKKLLHFK